MIGWVEKGNELIVRSLSLFAPCSHNSVPTCTSCEYVIHLVFLLLYHTMFLYNFSHTALVELWGLLKPQVRKDQGNQQQGSSQVYKITYAKELINRQFPDINYLPLFISSFAITNTILCFHLYFCSPYN